MGVSFNIEEKDRKTPLILLHGGPGGSLKSLSSLMDDLEEKGWPFIAYNQYGGDGNPVANEDPSIYTPDLFYTPDLWVKELIGIREYFRLDEVSLFGTSWGGMLAIIYLCDYEPKGVTRLVLDSTLASASLWRKECMRIVRERLSLEDQKAIEESERLGEYCDERYLRAMAHYQQKAVNPKYELPSDLAQTDFDNPAYFHAWGPNEFCPLGTLKDYEYLDKVNRIACPTLITSGEFDESTPRQNETLLNALTCPKRWVLFKGAYHGTSNHDFHTNYIETLMPFLKNGE